MKPKYFIMFVVLVLILLGGGYYYKISSGSQDLVPSATPEPTIVPTITPVITPKPPTTVVIPRMKFNKCVPSAAALSLKLGTSLRLENVSSSTIKVSFSAQTFNILPNDYAIATVQPVGTHDILCDGGKASKITITP